MKYIKNYVKSKWYLIGDVYGFRVQVVQKLIVVEIVDLHHLHWELSLSRYIKVIQSGALLVERRLPFALEVKGVCDHNGKVLVDVFCGDNFSDCTPSNVPHPLVDCPDSEWHIGEVHLCYARFVVE